jgi:hypothetical protein
LAQQTKLLMRREFVLMKTDLAALRSRLLR